MIDFGKLKKNLPDLNQAFVKAKPFNYIIIDDFLSNEIADKILSEFPENYEEEGWIHWRHYNENKHGLNNKKLIPSTINQFIDNLNSKPFIVFLEKLTSISNLVEDKTMEGAGISISAKGGFLNLHADFSTHPKDPFLVRKLNVLYYLNKDWHQDYKGDLEFWSKDMKYCELKIAPIFNRLVIFSTSETSYHGFPDPICCPDNIYRKSIALYYFNKTEVKNKLVTTTYKTKPGEKLKSIPVWLDNKLIYVYTLLKRKLKINDQYISKLLGVEFKKQNNSKSKKQ